MKKAKKAMKIRKIVLTNSKQDVACSLFLFLIIPVIFYYEIQVSDKQNLHNNNKEDFSCF